MFAPKLFYKLENVQPDFSVQVNTDSGAIQFPLWADFKGADFKWADFEEADFKEADFKGADLQQMCATKTAADPLTSSPGDFQKQRSTLAYWAQRDNSKALPSRKVENMTYLVFLGKLIFPNRTKNIYKINFLVQG